MRRESGRDPRLNCKREPQLQVRAIVDTDSRLRFFFFFFCKKSAADDFGKYKISRYS